MLKRKYLFKKYSIGDHYFVYESTYGQIYRFEKLIYNNISSLLNKKENLNLVDKQLIEEFEASCSNLFYQIDTDTDFKMKKLNALKGISKLDDEIDTITLSLTESCNLKCKYCVYDDNYNKARNISSSNIEFSSIKKILRKAKEHNKNNSVIDLNFYGGEPLLKFDLILKTVDYCKLQKIKAAYSITTNGTLFNEEIIEFMIHNNFNVNISLDINKKIHDKNRVYANNTGSYDIIKKAIEIIKEKDKDFYKKNVSYLATVDSNEDMLQVKQVLKNNSKFIVSQIEKNKNDEIEEFKEAKNKFKKEKYDYTSFMNTFDRILKNEQNLTNQLLTTLNNLNTIHNRQSNLNNIHLGGTCFPLGSKLFLSTNGSLFICEKIDYDLQLGSVSRWIDKEKIKEYSKLYVDFKAENCYYCWAKNLCSLCFHSFAKNGRFEENKIACFHEKRIIESNLKLYSLLCQRYSNEEIDKVLLNC